MQVLLLGAPPPGTGLFVLLGRSGRRCHHWRPSRSSCSPTPLCAVMQDTRTTAPQRSRRRRKEWSCGESWHPAHGLEPPAAPEACTTVARAAAPRPRPLQAPLRRSGGATQSLPPTSPNHKHRPPVPPRSVLRSWCVRCDSGQRTKERPKAAAPWWHGSGNGTGATPPAAPPPRLRAPRCRSAPPPRARSPTPMARCAARRVWPAPCSGRPG